MSQKLARKIIGKNYFGVKETIKYLEANPSKWQLTYLAKIPFSKKILMSMKDTHILIAIFPMSILDIRRYIENKKLFHSNQVWYKKLFCNQNRYNSLFYSQDWYNEQAFAKKKGEVGWCLIRKTPVVNSTNKTWNKQQVILDKDKKIPTAQVMVYSIVGHFLATGEKLFKNVYVRTSSLNSDGNHIIIGNFDNFGLYINYGQDNYHDVNLGLASLKKQWY